MLVGGDTTNDGITNRVFEGEITEDNKDVFWKEVESMRKNRHSHLTFKMNDSVYVAGGHSGLRDVPICERYDLKEHKWHKCEYTLPWDLYFSSVVVSVDESFALITGGTSSHISGRTNSIIIFTENHGFQPLRNSSLQIKRTNHVSIRID